MQILPAELWYSESESHYERESMPVQQQMSSFAGRLGARVAAANAEHKDKPIDTGNLRLPGGIKKGIAKIQSAYTKQQTEEKGRTPKGETFFRISAVAISPKEHNGQRVEGVTTSVIIPLCDIPERKGQDYTTPAVSFSENWFEFQNLFKKLGIIPPNEPGNDEAAGRRIEAYYFAAMKTLTDPTRPPVLIEFSTREWKSPKKASETPEQYAKREPMIIEDWIGLASTVPAHDPAASVMQSSNGQAHEPFEEPPQGVVVMPDTPAMDIEDEVASLVEVATGDPNGETSEGAEATKRLEDLAYANGWSKEDTGGAADWTVVGDMALNKKLANSAPPTTPSQPSSGTTTITVGYKAKFCKRTKDGAKLKNNKGEPLPPQDVEVTSVNAEAKTCTVKTTKDGKDVVDLRSKQPVQVKWEWLE